MLSEDVKKSKMLYLLYKIGRFLSLNLPLDLSYKLAEFCGSIYYFLAKRDRRVVLSNLKVVLQPNPDQGQVTRTARMVFVNFGRYLAEFFSSNRIDQEFIKENLTISGRENLDLALSKNRGVLLFGAHLGNWEFGAMFLSMLGYKVHVVAWTHKSKKANKFFVQNRQERGVEVIPLGMYLRNVFKILKNNEIVAVLGDRDYGNSNSGVKIKLFDQDTSLPKGPALLSLKTGAPVVSCYLTRKQNSKLGKFNLFLGKPIFTDKENGQKYNLTELTQLMANSMEAHIKECPEQWFMLHSHWPNFNHKAHIKDKEQEQS